MENTSPSRLFAEVGRDHLHIRGEYLHQLVGHFGQLGSPPHTWRILLNQAGVNPKDGITSTYVENTVFDEFLTTTT